MPIPEYPEDAICDYFEIMSGIESHEIGNPDEVMDDAAAQSLWRRAKAAMKRHNRQVAQQATKSKETRCEEVET